MSPPLLPGRLLETVNGQGRLKDTVLGFGSGERKNVCMILLLFSEEVLIIAMPANTLCTFH